YYQRGVSGSAFKEGQGYGYSRNQPDQILNIDTGQAMLVTGADQLPVLREASDAELQQLETETTLEEDEGEGDNGDVEEDDTGPAESDEDITGDEYPGDDVLETGIVGEEPPVTEGGEPAAGSLLLQAGTGGTIGDTGGTAGVGNADYIEDILNIGDETLLSGTISMGSLADGSFSAAINNIDNTGTVSISGIFSGTGVGQKGSITGEMGDRAFTGEIGLAVGSVNGTFAGIYLTGGALDETQSHLLGAGAGFLYGSLSGNITDGELSASGGISRSGALGTIDSIPVTLLAGETLADTLPDDLSGAMTVWGFPIPELGNVNAGASFGPGTFSPSVTEAGIATSDGTKLGIWSSTATGGTYTNTAGSGSWVQNYGESVAGSYYMLGPVNGTDDLAGHLTLNGTFDYLDDLYFGTFRLRNSGVYAGTSYDSAGSGTYELKPLTASGSFQGNLLRTIPGTSYEGDFERYVGDDMGGAPIFDAHYEYEYFIGGDNVLYWGERWEDEFSVEAESGELYFPTSHNQGYGTEIHIEEPGFYVPVHNENWAVGSLAPSFFETPTLTGTWWRQWYNESDSSILAIRGGMDGSLGIYGDLSTASASSPANLVLMGNYVAANSDYSVPSIFTIRTYESPSTTGIAYNGYLGGVIGDNVTGGLSAVYVTDAGDIGIMNGQFTGNAYQDINMWSASGTVYPESMGSAGMITPANLPGYLAYGAIAGWVTGDFGSAGSGLSSEIGWGTTTSISGHDDWGVFSLAFGYHNKLMNPGASWTAHASGPGQFGYVGNSMNLDSGYWYLDLSGTADISAGTLRSSGSSAGKVLTLSKMADLSGQVIGTFDSANDTWQAWASGNWENGQDLYFNGIIEGDTSYLRKEYHGTGETTGSGEFYSYGYDAVTDDGWSYYEVGSTKIHKNFHPDGTVEIWEENGSAVSSSSGTWSGSLLDNLKAEADSFDTTIHDAPGYFLSDHGWAGGYLGGLTDLWSAAYDGTLSSPGAGSGVYLLGESDLWEDHYASMVFSADIESYNPYDETHTIMNPANYSQNGAYSGYIGGKITEGSMLIDGSMLAIYLDSSGTAGIIKGDISGDVFDENRVWEAEGSVFPVPLVPGTGLSAAGLTSIITSSSTKVYEEELVGTPHGAFYNGTTWGGDIERKSVVRDSKITGGVIGSTPWALGVNSINMGGTYSGATDQWRFPYRSFDGNDLRIRQGVAFGNSVEAGTTGQWSGGQISGEGFGSWVSIEGMAAITGVSGTEIKGTFDPADSTWQASMMAVAVDTDTFLSLSETASGRNKLAELNIPAINIGRADLIGSGSFSGDTMNVNMNNVTFFDYSGSSKPLIWATGDVTGTYSGTPLNDGTWSVPLSSSDHVNTSGLTADFVVQVWDTGNNTWGANIDNGSGALSGQPFSFSGGAAGNIAGSAFSGTASGKAGPPE
ncbi:hypothetical protein ACFLZT_01340, partial [Thermodesulfobacteriota bacterium]